MQASDNCDQPVETPGRTPVLGCRIRIRGILAPRWMDYIGDMKMTVVNDAAGCTTVLTGSVPDQSALLGLILYLDQFGVSLLSLEWACPPRAPEPGGVGVG